MLSIIKKAIIVNIVTMMILSACNKITPVQPEVNNSREVRLNMDGMVNINQRNVTPEDKLIIKLKKGHPRQLGIKTPENKYFFIAATPKDNYRSLYSSEEFLNMETVEIDVKKFKLVPYEYNNSKKESVFKQRGYYELYLGNNLDSEETAINKTLYFEGRDKK